MRKKKQPTPAAKKSECETAKADAEAMKKTGVSNKMMEKSQVPKEMVEEFRRARHRFLFNVDQIEEKYCGATSGMVLNPQTEEYEFDPELCSAENDDELVKMLRRQQNCLESTGAGNKAFGSALLSAPAPDPEQTNNDKHIKRWRALNKNFDAAYEAKRRDDEERLAKENNKKRIAKWIAPDRKVIGAPAAPKRRRALLLADLDVSHVDFALIERYHQFGRQLAASELAIVKRAAVQAADQPSTSSAQISANNLFLRVGVKQQKAIEAAQKAVNNPRNKQTPHIGAS